MLWLTTNVLWSGASWEGRFGGGGTCDIGCASYVMVEMGNSTGALKGTVVPGHDRYSCILQNVDGPKLPLTWARTASSAPPTGPIYLRIFFRAAMLYVVGRE
jgi:hypothetical protein